VAEAAGAAYSASCLCSASIDDTGPWGSITKPAGSERASTLAATEFAYDLLEFGTLALETTFARPRRVCIYRGGGQKLFRAIARRNQISSRREYDSK
jgi:hypothetical protein